MKCMNIVGGIILIAALAVIASTTNAAEQNSTCGKLMAAYNEARALISRAQGTRFRTPSHATDIVALVASQSANISLMIAYKCPLPEHPVSVYPHGKEKVAACSAAVATLSNYAYASSIPEECKFD